MKTEPKYISQKLRSERAWAKTGKKLGFTGPVIREMYLHRWFAPIQARDFHDLVARGKITRENCLEHDSVAAAEQRIADMEKRREESKHPRDHDPDNLDRLGFELKGILKIGDYIEATETKRFCSKKIAYVTKGKLYRITEFKDEGFGNFTICTTTNLSAPDNKTWECNHGIRRLFRRGKLIWDWNAAWIRDYTVRNPQGKPYPLTTADKRLFKRLNWPLPVQPIKN